MQFMRAYSSLNSHFLLSASCLRNSVSSKPHTARCWLTWEAFATMAKPAVLQLGPAVPTVRMALQEAFDYYPLWEMEDPESFLEAKGELVRGIVTCFAARSSPSYWMVNEALVGKLPNLEIVASFDDVEVDKVDIPFCKKRGVHVTNIQNAHVRDCTAGTALALLMAITREIVCTGCYKRHCRWPCHAKYPLPYQLTLKRVGIIGLGKIGTAIAHKIGCCGGTIAYWGRSAKLGFPTYTYYRNVVDLARHCDVLIVTCALAKETSKIVNREVLDALGPCGFLVNISRCQVVDEKELAKALVEGRIAGAGLDVFEHDAQLSDELLTLDTVVLYPHHGDGSAHSRQALADLVVANLEAHFSGKQLLTPVC